MRRVTLGVVWVSRALHGVAGVSLVLLMLLTLADVALRAFGRPIPGVYELVGYAAGIAIGCALPFTAWMRGHVYVDVFILRLPKRIRAGAHIGTRLIAIGLFGILAWNLVKLGLQLRESGEVSATLEMPFYPVLFALALTCVVQVAALLTHVAMIVRGQYE